MLLESLKIPRTQFEAGTGWALKPEGACKGAVCIPLSKPAGDTVDVRRLAKDMGMPLVKARGLLLQEDLPRARKLLTAAALTYVSGALQSLLNIARWWAILRR